MNNYVKYVKYAKRKQTSTSPYYRTQWLDKSDTS